MPSHRLARGVQGQGGFTLVEMLIAMSIAVVLLGLVVQSLSRASLDQQDVERRTQMQTDAQIGLERMTREIRQATWLHFRSSSTVDLNVSVRPSSTSTGVYRLVRYDCSGDTCMRWEGAPVNYPPPATPSFVSAADVIGAAVPDTGSRRGFIVDHDVFRPTRLNPETGVAVPDFVAPDFLLIRLRMEIARLHSGERRITVEDGVSLRNRTDYAS